MGYPHKVFELICTYQSARNWKKRQAIDTLRGYKIRSRCHVIVFVSYMFEYCEIITILIVVTSICALV